MALNRREVEDDLMTQGLEGVSVQSVLGTANLYANHPLTPPDLDAYDPNVPPDIYAPTAAEMEPDLVPDEGWPPPIDSTPDL